MSFCIGPLVNPVGQIKIKHFVGPIYRLITHHKDAPSF